jgi:hypothetical protein
LVHIFLPLAVAAALASEGHPAVQEAVPVQVDMDHNLVLEEAQFLVREELRGFVTTETEAIRTELQEQVMAAVAAVLVGAVALAAAAAVRQLISLIMLPA